MKDICLGLNVCFSPESLHLEYCNISDVAVSGNYNCCTGKLLNVQRLYSPTQAVAFKKDLHEDHEVRAFYGALKNMCKMAVEYQLLAV